MESGLVTSPARIGPLITVRALALLWRDLVCIDQHGMTCCVDVPLSIAFASDWIAGLRLRFAPGGRNLGLGGVRWKQLLQCWSSVVTTGHRLRRR